MAIPTYDRFIEPILRILEKNQEGMVTKNVHNAAADILGLTEQEKLELLPSGKQQVYKNRAGWAHDRLKRGGLSTSVRKGFWKLTPQGIEYAKNNPSPLSEVKLQELIENYLDVRLSSNTLTSNSNPTSGNIPIIINTMSPDERLTNAIEEIKSSAMSELLDALLAASPMYFEIIVLDLLYKMGYGTDRSDVKRVGGVGDGGIDGIVSLDKLGFEKVYVQAKRWQGSVGRQEIQAFYGALAGQRANKGVFITTSNYTQQALDYAKRVEKVVLVDGKKLTELMIEYEVGISSKVIKVPKIDTDYFDEEST